MYRLYEGRDVGRCIITDRGYRRLIASGVDALCVIPNDIDALESVLKKAQDAGIVVVTHEASTQKNTEYDLEAFDNAQFGATIMDSLASRWKRRVSIA